VTDSTEVSQSEPEDAAGGSGPVSVSATPAAKTPRFRPGFAWGLATGAIAVVSILAIAVSAIVFIQVREFAAQGPTSPVVVSAVTAGKPWFSVGADGAGTLRGWDGGSSGDAGNGNGPAGTIAFFEVGNVGSVDGVTVTYRVPVYLTRKTVFMIGSQEYPKGDASSAAEALFGDSEDGPPLGGLEDRALTVEFHRDGSYLVADRVTASLETQTSPLDY